MSSEKRKFTRIPLHFPITLTLDNGTVLEIPEFINISIGGCLLPKTSMIAQSATCHISILLGADPEGNERIEADGEIVRQGD